MLSKLAISHQFSAVNLFLVLSACFAILILGGCAESEQETDIAEPPTFNDILSDVAEHGIDSEYKGQTVTITAAGRIVEGAHVPTIQLFTHNSKVRFFIVDYDSNDPLGYEHYYSAYQKSDLAHIHGHTTYTFTLLIKRISENPIDASKGPVPSEDRSFTIWADPPEHTEKTDIEIVNTTLEEIVADVSAGSKGYVGKTVRLQGTVSIDRIVELLGYSEGIDPQLAMLKSGQMPLATNKNNVVFWVVDEMGIFSALNLSKYDNQQTYTFTLYIESIWARKGHYSIFSGVADD